MPSDPAKNSLRVIAAYLDDVDVDLDAGRRLIAEPANRMAAFHLQQAAEKLVKAVRLSRGVRLTAEHSIELLVEELGQDDPWHAKLIALEPLSVYATTFRYPSPSGKRKDGLSSDEVLRWIKTIAALCAEARGLIGSVAPDA
jgi:HEPN domain-containing protein